MTLHLYFARQYLSVLIRVLLLAATLVFMVSSLDRIRRSGTELNLLDDALRSAARKTPEIIAEAMPVIIIVSAIWYCSRMVVSNQFVASRAAGQSALRSLLTPVACAFLVGVAGLSSLNPAIATLARQDALAQLGLEGTDDGLISVRESGLWLRQAREKGYSILHASGAFGDGTALNDVTIIEFDSDGDARRTVHADRAFLRQEEGNWILFRGKAWDLERGIDNPELTAEEFLIGRSETSLTRQQLLDGYPRPETIPIWSIPRFIRAMDAAGFSSRNYRLHFQTELARPFLFAAIVLIGAAFILGSARFRRLGRSAFLALLSGFAVHSLQALAKSLGVAGDLNLIAAAWFVPMAALAIGMSAVLFLEDG
ncbi:MAG: LptF/LptG family permease [Paracoccaceae bacterium]|nr:LptF/LptG family permease [Paracoccaceae bacterium]MDE2911842.1 LptF/LptG family permease [Paracoccaceae bacterium]